VGWRVFLEKHMDGKNPFSDQELDEAFEKYAMLASPIRAIFGNGDVQRS
jgi:hypothetical protein